MLRSTIPSSSTLGADVQLEELRRELASVAQLEPAESASTNAGDVDITDVVHDSRDARPGALFCAVPGLTVDGHDYVASAVSQGASALLVQRPIATDCPQLVTDLVRQTMAHAAAIVHRRPSRELAVFGITGTNGKTTTTQLLGSIVTHAGRTCSVIGTLDGVHTTPESTTLQR